MKCSLFLPAAYQDEYETPASMQMTAAACEQGEAPMTHGCDEKRASLLYLDL